METIVRFGPGTRLVGILTGAGLPADAPVLVLPNSGLVPRSAKHVKVLGSIPEDRKLAQKLAVHAHFISASAKEKLEAAGGAFHAIQTKASKPAPAQSV